MWRRIVLVFTFLWILVFSGGEVLGQGDCKTPLFITGGVPPNVLGIFDTSGSMSNILWLDEYDRTIDYSTPLLSQGKVVVFAREADDCYLDHHRVSYQTSQDKVKLRYRNYTSPTELCSGSDYQTQWSETDGYFYFDRSSGAFITVSAFDPTEPDHIRVFLPYATYSVNVDDTGQYSTWYDYNYMNWIFYHSTQAQRDALKAMHDEEETRATFIRMLAAQRAVKEVVNSNPDMRFGLMRFDGTKGGKIIATIPSTTADLTAAIDSLWAGGGTPLAETLEDAWDFFSDSKKSPIEYWCQKNFVVLMTDGQPTKDANDLSADFKKDWDGDSGGTPPDWEGDEEDRYAGNGSDYLDDIAYYMYQNDASDLDGQQNVITYTIGFTISNQLLLDTAFNGNGLHGREAEWSDPTSPLYHKYFYRAESREGLRESLAAAMREISVAVSSGTAVAVVSTATSTEDLVFRASFHPAGWKGFLEAFELTDDQTFNPANAIWEAGELLEVRNPDDRQIYTALKSATGVDNKLNFVEANMEITDVDDRPLFELLDTPSADDGKKIIRFIRGADVTGFRDRGGYKLGDIVDSTPVVVGPPEGYFTDPAYLQFRRDRRLRNRILYVGANDGMLHAFYVDDPNGGQEVWAFIPNNLLGKLKDLTSHDYDDCHEYFVDLSPTVADVLIDPDGAGAELRQWRTLLIGGEREGGKAYFALDVTEPGPDQVKPLWEFSDSRLGESWSIPAIERVQVGEDDRWLAFVGSGYNNDDGREYLFAIDLESGENFKDPPFELGPKTPNVLASPKAVDIDGDDYADSLFAGDLQGRVWRFDITDQTGSPETYTPRNPDAWEHQEIFQTLPGQPITLPVGLSFYCSGPTDQKCENLMIYFGTGKFLTAEDKTDVSLQSFYAIKDEFSGVTRDDPDMKNRTLSEDCEQVPDPYQMKGWYVDLTTAGERVSSPPVVMGGLVFFLTLIPDDDPCAAGGETWLYYREYDTGCVPNETILSDDPDPEGEERPVGKILIGPGYAPEIVYYAKTQDMLIQTSDRKIHRKDVTLRRGGMENYAWREVFY